MSSCSRSGRASPGRRQGQGPAWVSDAACPVPVMWFWEPPAAQPAAMCPPALGQGRHFGCLRGRTDPSQELPSASSAPSDEHHHPVGCNLLPLQGCCRGGGDRTKAPMHIICSRERHISHTMEQLLETPGFGKANAYGCWLLEMCCPFATGWSLQQHRGCQPLSPSSLHPCSGTRGDQQHLELV